MTRRFPWAIAIIVTGLAIMLPLYVEADGDGSEIPKPLRELTINGQLVTPESIAPVPVEGPLYQVRLKNGETFYSDAEGRHMVVGTLYDNAPGGLINLTEQAQREARLVQLQSLSPDRVIVFPAAGEERAVITVFTDTTCPYCQMLHQEIPRTNEAGITVHYVPFPRAGSGSAAARQLAQVMCSENPASALTAAFQGQAFSEDPSDDCLQSVDEGFRLGQRFGVKGTPSIVLPTGEMGEGYVPVEQLEQAVMGEGTP